jgi:hypothetical protein
MMLALLFVAEAALSYAWIAFCRRRAARGVK